MAKDDPVTMTPEAAVARHLEWLEFALAAARDEETRRRERLGKAADKNREKRTVRLAEVTAEVRELAALVQGLKALGKPAATPRAASTRRRSPSTAAKPAAKPTPRRRTPQKPAVAASASPATTTPTTTPTPAAPATATRRARPKASTTRKPSTTRKASTTRKPATRRRSAKPTPPSA